MSKTNLIPLVAKALRSAPKICVNFSVGLLVGAIEAVGEAVGLKFSGKTEINDNSLVELPERFDTSIHEGPVGLTSEENELVPEIIETGSRNIITTKVKTIIISTIMENRLVVIAAPLLIGSSWVLFKIGQSTIKKIKHFKKKY